MEDITIMTNVPKELKPKNVDRCTYNYGECREEGRHIMNEHLLCNDHFKLHLSKYLVSIAYE